MADDEPAIAIMILITTTVAAHSLLVSGKHRHRECLCPEPHVEGHCEFVRGNGGDRQ